MSYCIHIEDIRRISRFLYIFVNFIIYYNHWEMSEIVRILTQIKTQNKQAIKKKRPDTIESGIYATLRGTDDEDTLLIESTPNALKDTFDGLMDKLKFLSEDGKFELKAFVFIHLDSKQGPKVQVPGMAINNIFFTYEEFERKYRESIMELENRYIGGEEYNEQQLVLSRNVNTQFHYQVWDKVV